MPLNPTSPVSQQERNDSGNLPEMRFASQHIFSAPLLPAIVIAVLFAVAVSLFTPARFGFYRDDSIYVVTAKAIAAGEGYRIISLPQEPAQTKYPPFYPFLLSLVWRLQPQFPANIPILTAISLVATGIFLGLTYLFLTRVIRARPLYALLVLSLTALNWRTVLLATSNLSEPVYCALSVGVLCFAGFFVSERHAPVNSLGLGITMALAFLTRITAITLPLALISHHAHKRQLSRLISSLVIFGAALVGWLAWCYFNQLSTAGAYQDYQTSYANDWNNILSLGQTAGYGSALKNMLGMVAGNALMFALSMPVVCLGFDFTSLNHFGSLLFPLVLSLILALLLFIVIGFVRDMSAGGTVLHSYMLWYLGLHLLWPYTAYDRFLMPLLPFLLFFALVGFSYFVDSLGERLRSPDSSPARLAAILAIMLVCAFPAVALYEYGHGLWLLKASELQHASQASEDLELSGWLSSNSAAADILVCYRDSLYYLYTGRKAFSPANSMSGFQSKEGMQKLLQIIRSGKGKYLISTSDDFDLNSDPSSERRQFSMFVDEFHECLVPVFQSSNGQGRIYRIEPEVGALEREFPHQPIMADAHD
jgi:hypothetical protein